jgi:sporulation protein YlmC with PRC-barrel domain
VNQKTNIYLGVSMNVSEFLGTRVLDKNGFEIGKISDMLINPEEGVINFISISTGEFGIRRNDVQIKPSDVNVMGDYLLLNLAKEDLDID